MTNSSKRYRVGAIGFAHMHVNEHIRSFNEHPQVDWVACADTQPGNPKIENIGGTRRANVNRTLKETGMSKTYDDYREMLAEEQLDIVIFCPENARCGEVAEAVAAHGAHMITEKPTTASLPEMLRAVRAARNAGVALATNWPISFNPTFRKAKELIDGGEIGDVWQIKWRNGASLGPLATGSMHPAGTLITDEVPESELTKEWWYQSAEGGGALLDYCCYGACVSTWFLNQPALSAQAMMANLRSPWGDADDNAVILTRFADAMALLEASWTTYHTGNRSGVTVYGSAGTMVLEFGKANIFKDRKSSEPSDVVEGDPVPEERNDLARELIHHLETGDPLHPTLDVPVNIRAMAILDAGIRSARSGKEELVHDEKSCIG